MIRKQVRITAQLEAQLKQLTHTTGESEAAIIRQPLASHLQDASRASRLRA